jgi:PAS domain S-box-containing protein
LSPSGDISTASSEEPSSSRPTSPFLHPPTHKVPWIYVGVFLLVAGAVAAGTWLLIRNQERKALQTWETRLSSVADDRARLVSNWLSERKADAEVLADLPSVRRLLSQPARTVQAQPPSPVSRQIAPLLDRFTTVYGYSNLFVLDSEKRTVARATGSPDMNSPEREIVQKVMESGTLQIDLAGSGPRDSLLAFGIPVYGSRAPEPKAGEPRILLGAIVLLIPPGQSLFPLLTDESVPTQTGETILVRRSGNQVVYLSPLRFEKGRRYLRRSLRADPLAASIAAEGRESFGKFSDYRGVRVLAVTRFIPLTGWGLVRKIDEEEALKEVRRSAQREVLMAGLAVLLFGGALAGYRRRRMLRDLRTGMERQQAVLKAKEFAQDIVDNVPAGLLVLAEDLRILSANRWFLETFHLSREEVVGRGLHEIIHPEGPPRSVTGSLDEEGGPRDVFLDLPVAGTSEKRPVRISILNIEHEEGGGRLLLVVEDLSESQRLRSVAERSERRLRELIESLDAIVWEADAATLQFTFVSQRAEQLLGYPAAEWLAEPDFWVQHIYPEDREKTLSYCHTAIGEGRDHEFEYRMTAADGSEVWLRNIVRLVRDASGRPAKLRGLMVDVTERRLAQKALLASEAKYRSLVEGVPVGVYRTSPDGQVLEANPALAQMLGYGDAPSQLKISTEDIYVDAENRREWRELMDRNGIIRDFETPARRRDGNLVWLRDNARAVKEANSETVHYEGVLEDITERKLLEEQLRQAQKMEAVGRLAGGIAHDFNNLLTIISGYSDLLLDSSSLSDRQHAHVEEIKKAGLRAAALTRQLLAFSRRQVLAPQVLDLNGVVANMDKMLRRLIGEDVELAAILGEDLGKVKADPGQIEQVIMNLAVNARDAMPQGGKLTIETANVELDSTYARLHTSVNPGPYVMLAVSDTGTGMDAPTQAHIFEPFFTTKDKGKGTGLGLATVYGIVKQSGGNIWVYSEPGRGATFKIYLPRVQQPAREAGAGRAAAGSAQGHETILLVEDEPALRGMVRSVLESKGYKVLEARHGEDALIVSEQHRGAINLLLTDVVMPGMSGRELAEHLVHAHREMRVLYMSGYTDDAIVHHGVLGSDMAFLQKPFTPDGVARKVREVLDAAQISG